MVRATRICPPPALPDGLDALSKFVKAPKLLSRRLALIAVAKDNDTAKKLMPQLKAGQIIVTKEGSAWRWDGLVITPDAPSGAAIRLEQKNKLNSCKKQLPQLEEKLEQDKKIIQLAKDKREKIISHITDIKQQINYKESELHTLRLRYDELTQQNTKIKARISALQENIKNSKNETKELKTEYKKIKLNLSKLEDTHDCEKELLTITNKLETLRQNKISKQSKYDQLLGAEDIRKQRIEELNSDFTICNDNIKKTETRLAELTVRQEDVIKKQQELTTKPNKLENELKLLLDKISDAEEKRNIAADILIKLENTVNDLQTKLKAAEKELSDAKEARAHAKATVGAAKETEAMIISQIKEKFSCSIDEMLSQTGLDKELDKQLELTKAQNKLEKLLKERDNMGPVNLRADIEAQEVMAQIDILSKEREDLISAISKLRQAIIKINKEARERLLKAFDTVNKHFQDLFGRLFNGGSAYLELTDKNDPLDAGLEIYAQPPGKKMQILSLFSGGEQTLTSIALIFAMFLTNPAPICVLDEIDAPLDDSNVDRVCSLLEQLTKETSTRFIVITHHRMTMARVNRLYGVTMGEKGISQLVSVDLQQPSLLDNLAA